MTGATFASRVEQKYLLTPSQWIDLKQVVDAYMAVDQFGETTVCNLYIDTPEDLLVRRSMDKPEFKQKMRLRSYGIPNEDGRVYLELKKKLKGVVYKRRVACTQREAMHYLRTGEMPENAGQVFREIDALMQRLPLAPRTYLAYDRTAYAEKNGGSLRLTCDRDIRFRQDRLDLTEGDAGAPVIAPGMRLVEIKSLTGLPIWLCDALSDFAIYPASFSKIGQAFALIHPMKRSVSPCFQAYLPHQAVPTFQQALR